jgi:cytochrome c biogenesis protein CcdA
MSMDRETRSFIAGGITLLIGLVLLGVLFFVKIPEDNEQWINLLLGSFGTILGVGSMRFLGDESLQVKELKERLQQSERAAVSIQQECEKGMEHLVVENTSLRAKLDALSARLDTLQSQIIQKNLT